MVHSLVLSTPALPSSSVRSNQPVLSNSVPTATLSTSGPLGMGPIASIIGIINGLLLGVAVIFIFWHCKRNAVLPSSNEHPVEVDSMGDPCTLMFGEAETSEVGGRLGIKM